ncbi:MAG: hypothetical protein H7Y07_15040 [Pyrinomonadaceae bacterium]|nr:hypothetical protein [Sphingobacteriaceae bacterium]
MDKEKLKGLVKYTFDAKLTNYQMIDVTETDNSENAEPALLIEGARNGEKYRRVYLYRDLQKMHEKGKLHNILSIERYRIFEATA